MMGVTIESIGSKYAHTHTCIIVYGWYPASKELHTHTHTHTICPRWYYLCVYSVTLF